MIGAGKDEVMPCPRSENSREMTNEELGNCNECKEAAPLLCSEVLQHTEEVFRKGTGEQGSRTRREGITTKVKGSIPSSLGFQ